MTSSDVDGEIDELLGDLWSRAFNYGSAKQPEDPVPHIDEIAAAIKALIERTRKTEPELAIDGTALEFYFEAMLPEVPELTRLAMARAIRGGVKALVERDEVAAQLREHWWITSNVSLHSISKEQLKHRYRALEAELAALQARAGKEEL